jgi:hypothetical protein
MRHNTLFEHATVRRALKCRQQRATDATPLVYRLWQNLVNAPFTQCGYTLTGTAAEANHSMTEARTMCQAHHRLCSRTHSPDPSPKIQSSSH